MLGPGNQRLTIDHNLYDVPVLAEIAGNVESTGIERCIALATWRDRTGYDKHSVSLANNFADAEAGDFRPSRPLHALLNRTTASGWGTATLNGIKTSNRDIVGEIRPFMPTVGAFEVWLRPARQPDGIVTVQSGLGVTSAAVFDEDGQVALFQNLPLPKGNHPIWLPESNDPKPQLSWAQVRVVESNLTLERIGFPGNTHNNGTPAPAPGYAGSATPPSPTAVLFDAQDRGIVVYARSRQPAMIRGFDTDLNDPRWTMPIETLMDGSASINATPVAATIDNQSRLLILRQTLVGDDLGHPHLIALNSDTGKPVAIAGRSCRKDLSLSLSPQAVGMAALNGEIIIADTAADRLLIASSKDLDFARGIQVATPRWPVGDPIRNLVWCLSGERLVAIELTAGKIVHEHALGPGLVSLALRGDRLAVASSTTHRVHIFDCSNPAALKPITVMGSEWYEGQTGLGAIEPGRLDPLGAIALDSKGRLAVITDNVQLFSPQGAWITGHQSCAMVVTRSGSAPSGTLFGGDGRLSLHLSSAIDRTLIIDPLTRSWRPGLRFNLRLPRELQGRLTAPPHSIVPLPPHCFFTEGGWNFLTIQGIFGGPEYGLFRLDEGMGVPLSRWRINSDHELVIQRYDHQNGEAVAGEVTTIGADKKSSGITSQSMTPFFFTTDGRLFARHLPVPRQGIDGNREPIFDWSAATKKRRQQGQMVNWHSDAARFADIMSNGDWVTAVDRKQPRDRSPNQLVSPLIGPLDRWRFPGTTDERPRVIDAPRVLSIAPQVDAAPQEGRRDGKRRANMPAPPQSPINAIIARASESLELLALTEDGLGMGVLGLPGVSPFDAGDWSNPTLNVAVDEAGKRHIFIGDAMNHSYIWNELHGLEEVKQSVTRFRVAERGGTQLGRTPSPPSRRTPIAASQPATDSVSNLSTRPKDAVGDQIASIPSGLIQRLNHAPPMDGDPRKWVALGIQPYTIIHPFISPSDCSAVTRLAIHDQSIYVQVVRFDDAHWSPVSGASPQTCDAIRISAYGERWSLIPVTIPGPVSKSQASTPTTPASPAATRPATTQPAARAPPPHMVRDLHEEAAEADRHLIEALTGANLIGSKATIMQCRIDIAAYRTAPNEPPPSLKISGTIHAGITILDNDTPGLDQYQTLRWPLVNRSALLRVQ